MSRKSRPLLCPFGRVETAREGVERRVVIARPFECETEDVGGAPEDVEPADRFGHRHAFRRCRDRLVGMAEAKGHERPLPETVGKAAFVVPLTREPLSRFEMIARIAIPFQLAEGEADRKVNVLLHNRIGPVLQHLEAL